MPGKIAAAVAFDSCVRFASALIAFPLCANLPSRRPLRTCCASSYCMTSRLASFCCTNPAVFCCPNPFESCSPLPCRRPLRIHCATFCCTTPHSVTAPCSAVPSLMHPVPLSPSGPPRGHAAPFSAVPNLVWPATAPAAGHLVDPQLAAPQNCKAGRLAQEQERHPHIHQGVSQAAMTKAIRPAKFKC